ncbi:MAG: hypothetical protein U5L45_11660 [Saprospiraceae bacterium]|nr:hypothetical protein [Saprospiraceae bacterium]
MCCLPKMLSLTHRGFVGYCEDCECVNICFEQLLVQRSKDEFLSLCKITTDYLFQYEPFSINPNLRNLEFSRFAYQVSWMVSINDLKDLKYLLDEAQKVFEGKKKCAQVTATLGQFSKKLPELFRFNESLS